MSAQKPQVVEKISGQFYEAVMEALNTIRNNKMRSALVILGVLIGVMSLMGMVSTISGLNNFIAESFSAADTPILGLTKIDFTKGEGSEEWLKRRNFKVEDAYAIQELPHVEGVMIKFARNMVVKYKDRKAQLIAVIGSNQEFLKINSLNLAEGRFFTEEEQNKNRKLVVLGDKANKSLFPNEDAIGKPIRIQGKEYVVTGVMESRKTFMGSFAENYVAIPYGAFQRDFQQKWEGPDMNIIVDSYANLDAVEDNVRALMRMRRKVPLNEPDDFAIITVDGMLEFTRSITDNVALVMVVLASIALMVGGIGVMVIMLVSVTERTHEIGVRKAIGATRGQITLQFLIEAATLSGMGGLFGIIAGLAAAFLISRLIGFPFIVPIGWTFFAVAISAGVGLFFGIFPAHKAARLDPVVALRYE